MIVANSNYFKIMKTNKHIKLPSTNFFSFIYDLIDFSVYVQPLRIAQLTILYDFEEFNIFYLYWLHSLSIIIVLILFNLC